MALSADQKRKLLARELPAVKETVAQMQDYMARTGLEIPDMARRIGYAPVTLYHLTQGRYENVASNSVQIRAAIIDFMSAHPIDALTESQGRLHETENVRVIRKCFYESLDGRKAYYFRGAPGSQKTFVLQHLIAELNRAEISKNGHGRRAFYVRARHGIKPTQMMKRIAEAAGSSMSGDVDRILRNLRFDLGRRKVIFVIDEAQLLDIPCLETLRELLDMPPHCGLLFAGSHELESIFSRLDMEQWKSRLRKGAELPGIQEHEAAGIIRTELGVVKPEKINELVKKCYTTDQRKGREVKYISARLLFFALQAIQDRQKSKGEDA
ncbi:MAG: ATP-binding protein [Terriglobales bacterium]